MLHPVLRSIDPALLIAGGVETMVTVHVGHKEVLSIEVKGGTSVNFPL